MDVDDQKYWDFYLRHDEDWTWFWRAVASLEGVFRNYDGGDCIPRLFQRNDGEASGVVVELSHLRVRECPELLKEAQSCAVAAFYSAEKSRLQQLREMPYSEYLETDEWKKTRRRKLKSVGRSCQVCNANKTQLDVHHRTYERIGEELDDDLTVLCHDCHGLFHRGGKLVKED